MLAVMVLDDHRGVIETGVGERGEYVGGVGAGGVEVGRHSPLVTGEVAEAAKTVEHLRQIGRARRGDPAVEVGGCLAQPAARSERADEDWDARHRSPWRQTVAVDVASGEQR